MRLVYERLVDFLMVMVGCWAAASAAACQRGAEHTAPIHYPITSGMYRQIPTDGTSFCLAVNQPIARDTAIRWLEQRGYTVTNSACGLRLTVEVGEETAIRGGMTPTVDVDVVDPSTGIMLLRGTAAMPIGSRLDDVLRGLTCQALATAWGYRPAGQLEIPSSLMCTVGIVQTPRA
jgi:hypothetical protein